MKWLTVKFLWIKFLCTLEGRYTEGTCLYCDCFLLGMSCIVFVLICTVVVLYCFVKCVCVCGFCNVCVCVCVGFVMCVCLCSFLMCGCFGNM